MIRIALILAAFFCARPLPAEEPAVTRASEGLRGRSYALVLGEGFVEGETSLRYFSQSKSWDAAKAIASLEAGPTMGLPPEPLPRTREARLFRTREDVVLAELVLPPQVAPAILWLKAAGESARPWVINRPQLWWLLTDRAAPGERVRGFGRNLLGRGASKPPMMFLRKKGLAPIACKFAGGGIDGNVTDPLSLSYETSFHIPEKTPEGHYQVWFHSGMGGPLGWSGPLELEVARPEPQKDFVARAEAFGMAADGVADDTIPLAKAARAAREAGGGTVLLPPGRILLSNTLTLPPGVNLRGAGTDATILAIYPRKDFQGFLDIDLMPANKAAQGYVPYWRNKYRMLLWVQTRSAVTDFTLDLDGLPAGGGCGIMLSNGKEEAQDCTFERLAVIHHPFEKNLAHSGQWIPQVTGGQALSSTRRVRVTHCRNFNLRTMYGCKARYARNERNFNGAGLNGNQIEFSLFEENTIRDLYLRRGILGGGQYVATFRNRVEETWLMPGGGEQYLREGGGGGKPYPVLSATPTTLTVKGAPEKGVEGWRFIHDLTAVIIAGKGKWQVRRIQSFRGGAYVIAKPWDVLPNETSLAVIGPFQCRSLWVRNESGGGMNSLLLYVGNVEQIVAGHHCKNSGMLMMFAHYGRYADAWFNEFRNCRVERGDGMEAQVHVYFRGKPPERMAAPPMAGCEWRDNLIEDAGFSMYSGDQWGDIRWREFYTQGALMIHTARRGLLFDGLFQYAHLITGNTVRRPRTGSGIFVGPDTSNIFVIANHFEDCPTNVSHYGRDRVETYNQW